MTRTRAEDGFTLVELLVTTLIVGVIMGALSSAVVVGLRTTDETTERLADSHDLQLLSVYWPADVQSAVEGRIKTGAVDSDCTGGPSETATSENVVRFQWDQPAGTETYEANYRYEEDGDKHVLARYSCVDGSNLREVVVAHGLGTSAPTVTESGRSITLALTLASGLTSRVTATRRTPGAVPPDLEVAFPVNGGEYNDAGWNAGCSTSGLCGTASDGSGIQSVEVAVLRVATNLYWNGSTFSSASAVYGAASGTTSWNYAFPAASFPAEGSYAVIVRATNTIGTQTSTTDTFVVDRSLPVTSDNTAAIGSGWKNVDQTVTLSPTDSGGSGVDATYYTANGPAPTTASSKGTSIVLSSEGTHTVKYFSVDGAGNQEAVKTAGTVVRIDKTAPTAVTLSGVPSSKYLKNGQTLTGSATESLSGLASLDFLYCVGADCTPSTSLGTSTANPGSVTWNAQPADGAYRLMVRATDNAGNVAESAVESVTIDNTAPAVDPAVLTLTNGGTAGRVDRGDKVTIGFSEALKPSTLCAGWTDDTAPHVLKGNNQVSVTVTNATDKDTLTVSGANGCTGGFKLGTIALNADYVSADTTFSGSGGQGDVNTSSLTWDPTTKTLTIKLGSANTNGNTNVGQAAITFTPAVGLTDLAGHALPTTPVVSTGPRGF